MVGGRRTEDGGEMRFLNGGSRSAVIGDADSVSQLATNRRHRPEQSPMPSMPDDLRFTSFPFSPSESIPSEYTCEGADVSPSLEWTRVPDGTESIALVVDDPDAPGQTFTHWVLFNLPGDATRLPKDVDLDAEVADQDLSPREGANDFGDVGYGGPCPPPGDGPHRYFFRLYALDTVLDLERGASKAQVTDALNGHVLDETDLVGTYER